MNTIITLGPQDTFSGKVAEYFNTIAGLDASIQYIRHFNELEKYPVNENQWIVLPVENSTSGFVHPVVDFLIKSPYSIAYEIKVPIQYFLVGTAPPGKNETLHVQFVAAEQTDHHIQKYAWKKVRYHQSNAQAFDAFTNEKEHVCAVIPQHVYGKYRKSFSWSEKIIQNSDNITRFFILGNTVPLGVRCTSMSKTSLVLMDGRDEPGQLYEILKEFARAELNLFTIFSRPTRKSLGSYYFYMDVEGNEKDEAFRTVIKKIRTKNKIKVLGSYHSIVPEEEIL